MTDASAVLIVGSIAGSIAGVVAGVPVIIKAWADARAAKEDREDRRRVASRVEEVAVAAREVKATLDTTTSATADALAGLTRVTDATHVLVNKRYGEALHLAATAARDLATVTGTAQDAARARTAERLLAEHVESQARVDRGEVL